MPPRREREYDEWFGPNTKMLVRWTIQREVLRYAVTLVVRVDGSWHTVVVFDCSHGDRNDRHRYTFDGVKGAAETFHHGTPGEAMNDATDLIRAEHERMIERWRH